MNKKKILIIEDEIILTEALILNLEPQYQVIICKNGLDGFNKIPKIHPDLILLDIILPEMHGFDILSKTKDNPKTKDIPIIILSNLASKTDISKGLKLGAQEYLLKVDTDLKTVVSTIQKIIQ